MNCRAFICFITFFVTLFSFSQSNQGEKDPDELLRRYIDSLNGIGVNNKESKDSLFIASQVVRDSAMDRYRDSIKIRIQDSIRSAALKTYRDSINIVVKDSIARIYADSVLPSQKKIFLKPDYRKNPYWTKKNTLTFDLSEVAFVNWNAGGTTSISGLLGTDVSRYYKRGNVIWENRFTAKYGLNKQEDLDTRKTDDQFEFVSTFGHRKDTTSNWYNSANFSFKSQFANGYNHSSNDSKTLISQIMSPAYLFLGVGSVYGTEEDDFSIYLSPLTFKETFVLNQELADKGAFGVKAAEYDTAGNKVKDGENFRTELGIMVRGKYDIKVMENIVLRNRYVLYTDYVNNFGNIDVDWEFTFDFKVNEYIRAVFGSHIIYDDDVKVVETLSDGTSIQKGASIQWKQTLGIGVVVNL